jgi:hypothetical protein
VTRRSGIAAILASSAFAQSSEDSAVRQALDDFMNGWNSRVADAERLLTQAEIDDALARLSVWRALLSVAAAQGDLQPFLDRTQ